MSATAAHLCRGLDIISRFALYCSAVALGAIVLATTWDIVLRYFLNSPTYWASDVVGFLFCVSIFMAIPDVARQRGHVTIAIVVEMLPIGSRRKWECVIFLLSAATCLFAAWLSADETLRQIVSGIGTVGTFMVPKWGVSIFIVVGFALTGLQFLRLAFDPQPDNAKPAI